LLRHSREYGKSLGEDFEVSEKQVAMPHLSSMDENIKGEEPLKLINKITTNGVFDAEKATKYLNSMTGSLVQYKHDKKTGEVYIDSEYESPAIREQYLDRYRFLIAQLGSKEPKEQKNLYADKIFEKTQTTLNSAKSGVMTLRETIESQKNNNATIDELLDPKKTSITDAQRETFIKGQIESDIEFETMIKAHRIVEDSIGKKDGLDEIATNGAKFFVTVTDRTGKNKAKTVDVFVTPEQIVNITQTQIKDSEQFIVDSKTGQVNGDIVKSIVSAIQSTDGKAKSSVLESSSNAVFNVGMSPMINSKKDLLSYISIQELALKYNMKPAQFKSTMDAQAYLTKLKNLTSTIVDNPSDKNNASNMSKKFAEYKEQATMSPSVDVDVVNFVSKYRTSVYREYLKEDRLNELNKILGLGNSMPISEDNHTGFIKKYKEKYPNDGSIIFSKYSELIKDEGHYIGGSMKFGSKNVILPPLRTSKSQKKVTNYQIMDTLTPEMKRLGIENLEDLEDAKATVMVNYDKYGNGFLQLKYYDAKGKQFKVKMWTADEVSEKPKKAPLF
jgi:hypothetical protein